MNELFTRVEAARRLGLSPTTLAKAALTGRGPRYIKLGRRVCYTAADLDSWVAACRTSDTADASPTRC